MDAPTKILPEPLSAKFVGSFAYKTLKDRLPAILTKAIDTVYRQKDLLGEKYGEDGFDDFKSTVGRMSKLRYELQTNKPLYLLTDGRRDVEQWNEFYEREKAKLQGEPCWFIASWLYVECFLYRSIQEALQLSSFLKDFDPFEEQKRSGFMSSQAAMIVLGTHLLTLLSNNAHCDSETIEKDFRHMMELSLWGNKCDLSISGGEKNYQQRDPLEQLDDLQPYLLVDDIPRIWHYLSTAKHKNSVKRIDIILDNAGFELFGDLCLAEFLIKMDLCSNVHLHAKIIPWFVSDTTAQDFWWTLEILRASNNKSMSELGTRWHQRLKEGSFVLSEEDFWTLPHDYNEMNSLDSHLFSDLSQSTLIIFKGDLNYRKLTKDLQWPHTTPFPESLRGLSPAPLCVLRTLKADLVVGLKPGQDSEAEKKERDWMTSGNFAVIQFCDGSSQ